MAEVVNLRQARKRKARTRKEAQAAENRFAFGRSKSERRIGDAQEELAKRRHDSHRLADKEPA